MNMDCRYSIISEGYIDFIADYALSSTAELASSEICVIPIDNTFSAVYIPDYLVPERSLDEYGYKVFIRLFGLMDELSLEKSGVKRVRSIPGLNLRGQGVLIGIVDTGIDYTHPAFIKADGTSKIVSIWDQSIQGGNPPEGLYYGTEYTRNEINLALRIDDPLSVVPSTDEIRRIEYRTE